MRKYWNPSTYPRAQVKQTHSALIPFMYVQTKIPHSQNSYPSDKAEGLSPTVNSENYKSL